MRRVVPEHPEKDSIHYDMKSRPSRYVHVTYLLALLTEGSVCSGFEFCPLRTSSVPCHVKLDTEAAAHCFVPYKEVVKERKASPDMEAYNDWVWGFILNRNKVDRKSRKFRFHHEITTDGVAASLLFSREVKVSEKASTCTNTGSVDNVATLEDPWDLTQESGTSAAWGLTLRYTTRQRNFESGLTRYRWVITKERRSGGIEALETDLSLQTCKTTNEEDFLSYVAAKRVCDEGTRSFYHQPKWRRWKFRMFCRRKTSEDRFLKRVADTYGSDCTVYLRDWSHRDQMKGCAPSPTVGLEKMLRKKFEEIKVDKFRTSKVCNRCKSELSSYEKRMARNRIPGSAVTTVERQKRFPSSCGQRHERRSQHLARRKVLHKAPSPVQA